MARRGPTTTEIPSPAAADATPPPVARRRRRVWFGIWTLVVVVVAAGVLLVTVLPSRAWLAQRREIDSVQAKVDALQAENDRLNARIAALGTPEEIERLAREQYQLTRPGERQFAVLAAAPVAGLPEGWPYSLVQQIVAARGGLPLDPPTSAAPASTTG